MTPRQSELLDAADTEEERGNLNEAERLRKQAAKLDDPWTVLDVEPYDTGTFLVSSQTRRDVRHIVDLEANRCSCEWSLQFGQDTATKQPCAHLKRVRQWIQETGHRS